MMAWRHYENDIVRGYGVKLEGWPLEKIERIDNYGLRTLQRIRDALETGACKWVRCKKRASRKEPTRRSKRTCRSPTPVSDDDVETSDNDANEDNNANEDNTSEDDASEDNANEDDASEDERMSVADEDNVN